jgi:ribosomal protein S18 acetylase RimI-like enzyme
VTHPLDNPVYAALTGPHAALARRSGYAVRYPADITPFCGLPAEPSLEDWKEMAGLFSPGEAALFPGLGGPPPAGWKVLGGGNGVQLVADGVDAKPDPEAVPLGPGDAQEMVALADRARPGPFLLRTVEFGGYLGIRRDGELVAMAGERFRPPGFTEISAVCTDAAWRGHGFASRLTLAVAAAVQARGETPFLHAVGTNANAIRLYKSLGFTHRRDILFQQIRRSLPGVAGPS